MGDVEVTPPVPRVAFLGFCERIAEVRAGHPALWHNNILGVANSKVSHVYPLNLRGHKVLLAIHSPFVGEEIRFICRGLTTKKSFEFSLHLSGAIEHGAQADVLTREELQPGAALSGWVFLPNTFNADIIVVEPDTYAVFYISPAGEHFLCEVGLGHAPLPPFTEAEVAAIRSDPLALKWVRGEFSCKTCDSTLKTYAGIEKSEKLESEGWVRNYDLPERFTCKCGKTEFSLIPLRTGLHGLLRRRLLPLSSTAFETVSLYERTALEEDCRRLQKLLDSDPHEEEVQNFLEAHKVFFSLFQAKKLIPKAPVLSKYVVDFALLNERKELILIEIERPGIKLLKKDGGIRHELQHAFDQVRSWLREFDDHRIAALDCIGLKVDEVARVRGIVVAGRTPADQREERNLRSLSVTDIELLTYDDMLRSVTEIIRQIAAAGES
jgi:hypothetical protein